MMPLEAALTPERVHERLAHLGAEVRRIDQTVYRDTWDGQRNSSLEQLRQRSDQNR